VISIDPVITSLSCSEKLGSHADLVFFADVLEWPVYEGKIVQFTNAREVPAPPVQLLYI